MHAIVVAVGSFRFGCFRRGAFLLCSSAHRTMLVSYNYYHGRRRGRLASFVLRGGLALGRLLYARLRISRMFKGNFVCGACNLGPRTGGRSIRGLPSPSRRTGLFKLHRRIRGIPIRGCVMKNRVVGFNASRLRILAIPKRSPNDVTFCGGGGNFTVINSTLFTKDVNHASL